MPYIGNPIYQSAFVTDQFSGTGSQTAYTMSVAPAGTSNVLVAVSGVLQDPSTYGVVGNTLNFTTAPPPGTGNISCRYLGVPVTGVTTTAYRTVTEFTATAGQTTFTPPSYTVGYINVYRNGVLLGSADYTASNGTTVVLATGASAGNLVTVESFYVSSVLNAIPNSPASVGTSNIQSSVTLTTPTIDKINTSVTNTSLGAGNSSIMKNRIINGAMVIDQRNGGSSFTPTNGGFGLDRWKYTLGAASKITSQQVSTAPAGFNNSLLITSSSAYSIGSGDYFAVYQNIEGFNFADCAFGTASAKTVTLSFQVRSTLTGTFGGSLTNSAQDRCYPFSYTISSANTWTSISITIAGDTTGTWVGATNGTGASVWFGLGVGSSYSGTAGAWNSSSFCISSTGATSLVGTSGATLNITGVQLEVGSSATGFEYVNYQTSLANCQRYFAKIGGTTSTETLANGMSTDLNTAQYYCVYFPVNMRSAPTATISSIGASDLANGTVTANSIRGQLSGVNTCQLGLNTNSAAWLTTYRPMAILTTATAGNISLSAEL